ncbi:Fic family protein [Testudinibacter sp. P27/CKL/0425]
MKPPFELTNQMLNRIVEISHKIGQLQGQYERNLHLHKENRIRSIQSSLAIENNSLTIEQVSDIINGKPVLGDPQEIHEVQNAYQAYEAILSFDPYSVTDFLRAHGLLTQGLVSQAGVFREKDVGIFDGQGNVLHLGARPEFVPRLVQQLFDWAKTDDTPDLIKSAVLHYEIEMIHPFADGNGRMGRLWQSVLLSRWNPLFAWLPVETIVYQHQQDYYAVLRQADKSGRSTVFIEFMLDRILETLEQYSLTEMSEKVSDKMSELSETARAMYRILATHLANHTRLSGGEAQQLLNKPPATTRRYLANFVALGLLEAIGTTKNRYYQLPSSTNNRNPI